MKSFKIQVDNISFSIVILFGKPLREGSKSRICCPGWRVWIEEVEEDMYAVLETGGKQYRVQVGDEITVEKLGVEADQEVVFDKVLAVGEGSDLRIGSPYVEGASVKGTVVENGKGKKIIVFKYKAKKDYRKKRGHRQPYTTVKIDSID